MSWSVVEYVEALTKMGKRCTGMQEHIEKKLCQQFPPAESESIVDPYLVTDSEGNILLWFLPGLLGNNRQVNFISLFNFSMTIEFNRKYYENH
jgi:hypothetical protein